MNILSNFRNRTARTYAVHRPHLSDTDTNNYLITKEFDKYFNIFTNILDEGILIIDRKGQVLKCNKSAEQLFSCRTSEIIGQKLNQTLHSKILILFFDDILERVNKGTLDFNKNGLAYEQSLTTDRNLIRAQIAVIPTGKDRTDAILFFLRNIFLSSDNKFDIGRIHQIVIDQMIGTIESIAQVVEFNDPYTAHHQRRVAHLGRAIAKDLDLHSFAVDSVFLGGWIHDIGKISVPQSILCHPGKLDQHSMALIMNHCFLGGEIVKNLDFMWPIAQIILQHHERLDGTGYPRHLVGDFIQTEAKVIAVADVVEAISSHRPYRPGLGIDFALEEITTKPHLYDKSIAESCRRLFCEKGYQLDKYDHDTKLRLH